MLSYCFAYYIFPGCPSIGSIFGGSVFGLHLSHLYMVVVDAQYYPLFLFLLENLLQSSQGRRKKLALDGFIYQWGVLAGVLYSDSAQLGLFYHGRGWTKPLTMLYGACLPPPKETKENTNRSIELLIKVKTRLILWNGRNY